ncbi:ATP-binding protein [Luteimonas sp. S4-F44]|uniref:two-component system sensor histidine kinase NtrB n=1 Tax=Luteimonas sp. S4-F44 TaxID=2925842 RepID=UPI001F5359B6|nr:ATP-binding protein [Luteimonas sp. S4-F44]UNK42562.1 ATP-binding protein [Luteimonas sp. S4-F44]
MLAAALPAADFDALATPLVWAEADGRIRDCNLAFARWLGVGRRRLLEQPLAALEVEGETLRQALREPGDDSDAPLRLRRLALAFLGGEPRFADAWVTRAADGGVLLEAHPVDEFPGADPTLAMPLALSAALRGLAHELRNPLAGLKGAAQLLARRAGDGETEELVALVGSEVGRLSALVDQLLSPQAPQPHRPLNIHGVLEQVLRLAEADAGWAVRMVRDYDPSLPELLGDADRLTQAIWNLVRNAIQAGAANVTLRTRAALGARIGDEVHAMALRLEVVDDGRGVPGDLVEQIFLPLVSGRPDGSGLGLALAQQVAREHRGALVYRSRPGHTVFTLQLPFPPLDAASALPADAPAGTGPSEAPASP